MTFPIFDIFGGRGQTHNQLVQRGYAECTQDALRLWEHRKQMPGWGVIALWKMAKELRKKVTPSDFEYKPPQER